MKKNKNNAEILFKIKEENDQYFWILFSLKVIFKIFKSTIQLI